MKKSTKWILLGLVIFCSSLMMSCSKEKIEIPARVTITYYDIYDNQVHGSHLTFLKGKRNLESYFEYENKEHTLNRCNEIEKKIIDKSFFQTSYIANKMFYSEEGGSKFDNFLRIEKLKFECRIPSKEANKDCMSELASKYLNEEMGGNTSRLNQLSTEQGAELVRRVGSKVEFHKALGTCDYEVIQSSRVYNIVDLMK